MKTFNTVILLLHAVAFAANLLVCLTSWNVVSFLGVCWTCGWLGLLVHRAQDLSLLPDAGKYHRNFARRPATPLLWKD